MILIEGDIADPVGAVLNEPMMADEAQQAVGVGLGTVEAGEPEDGLGADLARGTQESLTFEAEDLFEARPVC